MHQALVLPHVNNGHLRLADTVVPFELRRSHRRRTLSLSVTSHQVRIHAPAWTPRAEIALYLSDHAEWLERAWAQMRERRSMPAPDVARTQVCYLGHPLMLEIHPSLFTGLHRRGRSLYIDCPLNVDVEALVRTWLQTQAGRVLAWRMAKLARRLGRVPTRFALSNAQTQWGSCTRQGHIRLNWRLVQVPLDLIDYVAAHELAHLIHLNHSDAFWAQVAALCPAMRERRARLRKMSTTWPHV